MKRCDHLTMRAGKKSRCTEEAFYAIVGRSQQAARCLEHARQGRQENGWNLRSLMANERKTGVLDLWPYR